MPKYILNGKSYNIPDNLVGKFEKENPNATMSYSAGGKKYNIPVSKKEKFLKAFPDATTGEQPVQEQKPTPQPQTSPAEDIDLAAGLAKMGYTFEPAPAVSAQNPKPEPMKMPNGFGQLDLQQAQQMGMGKGPVSWEEADMPDHQETVVEKTARMMSGGATKEEQEDLQKRMRQRMDEAEYESQTGKRLRQKVLNPEWEAPTVSRDEYGNIQHTDNGDIITGFTTDENAVDTHRQIVQEQKDFDQRKVDLQQNEQLAQQRLEELNRELKTIDSRYEDEFMEKEKGKTFLDRFFEAFRMPTVNGQTPFTEYKMQNRSQDEMAMINNRRVLEEAMASIEDAKRDMGLFKEDDPWYKSAAKGLGRAYGKAIDIASTPETWDFGASDMEKQFALLQAVIRNDNGIASKAEKDLLNDFALSTVLHGNYDGQISGWTKAGMVTGESLPFMLEMFANPAAGIGTKVSEQAFKYAIKKYGAKYVRDHMKSLVAKKIAAKVAGDLVGAHVMAGTTGALRTVANAYERMRGDILTGVDENGRIIYDGHEVGDSAFDAFSKAWRDTAIENWSEMAGEYLPVMTGFFGNAIGKAVIGKAGREALKITGKVENVGLSKVQKFIYDLAANKGIGTFSKGLDSFLKRTQWHGVLGEYSEEVLGNLANALTIGDMTLDTAEGTGVFNLQQNIDTFNGVALMGGFTSALQTGGFGLDKYRNSVSRRDKQGAEAFGKDWERIKTAIGSSADDARELNSVLTDFLGGDIMDKHQKQTVLNYTSALLQSKGAEMANYQPRMQSSTTEEVSTPEGKRYVVTSLDKNGETISQQAFETEDEAKAYEGELKMQQQKQDFDTYFEMSFKPSMSESENMVNEFLFANGYNEADDLRKSAMMAAINDPSTVFGKQFQQFRIEKTMQKARNSQASIAAFEEENGWTPGTVRWLSEQDPMQLDEEGLEMQDQARDFLETLAYPSGEVHVEHEQDKGAETGQQVVEQVLSEDEAIDPNDNAGQKIQDAWDAAQAARQQMFDADKTGDIQSQVEDLEGKGFSPQEILSQLDTFTPEQRQVMADYYNAEARYKSMLDEAARQIDSAAKRSRERHTFKGTIDGKADVQGVHQITDGTNTYYLVSGNITTNPATGMITGSTSGLIIGMDENGDFVNIGDSDGYSVLPVTQSLDQFEEEERIRLQQQVSTVINPNGAAQAVQQTGSVGGEAGGTNATGANEPPTPETVPETPQGSALDRIPKDEGGNPLYEQASPEDAYDALVEQSGSEANAKALAQSELNAANKRLEKLKKTQEKQQKGELRGTTMQEKINEMQETQKAIETEQAKVDFWTSVLAVPNNRMLNASNNRPAGTPPSGAGTPPTPPAGGGENVPDWSVDKASDARARGFRMTNGHRVDRQQPITDKAVGNEVEVKFDKDEEPVKGFQVAVMDAGSLVPSHVNGQRNVLFFIDEAQPKDRTDVDSEASSNRIAEKINPEEITGGVTAYTGSPVVNTRGEVIQGNNRTIGLQKMWGNAAYEESQKKYKQYLIDHAAEFGLDPAEIEQMQSPVLVRMVDVTDEEAIRLGQKTAANTESGGIERIDPMRTIQAMGDNIRIFMSILFGNEVEGQTLMSMIAENGVDVLKWLNDGRNHPKYITDTQYQSCFDRRGNLTEEAKTDLKKIVEGMLFAGAPDRLSEMFYNMPAKAQNAILATFWRDAQSPEDARILQDIQEAIEAFAVISGASEEFRNSKNVNEARVAVKDLQKQTQMFGNTSTVLEKFSNFALELAIRFKGDKQNTIRDYFNGYYDAVQGKGGTLFEPAATKTKAEAIQEIFGIDINEETNGEEGSNTLGSNNQNGEAGQPGGTTGTGNGKPVAQGEQPAVGGGGSSTGTLSEREQYIADHPLTEAEIDASDASQGQKILAKQYLNSKDDYVSEMAKAAYTLIYNKKVAAQSQGQQPETPSRPRNEAPARPQKPQQPETPPTPPSTGGQQGGTQNSAQAAARAKMAAALAKLKKHGKKLDSNTDAYSIENLTPEQIEDMFEVVEAGAELGYTLLDGVQTKEEWISQMREAIAEPLKDATGYNDTEVDELLNDMWNYPYEVEGQTKTVSEWAAEKGINVNVIENGTGESNGDNPSVELPGSTTVGSSAEMGVESGGNNEGQPESGGETVSGTNAGGNNTGTQGRGQTTGGRQRSGGTGSTRGKAGGTRQSGQPGNLFGEDNGNGTNDTPGIEQGGTVATVPEGGIVVPQTDGKPKKPLADITQEKSPYKPASIGGKFAIGSVIPSGIADSIANAFKRLKEKFFPKKGSTLDFVREELGYKTNEEMLSDFESGKTDGLAAEQVDAVALAIGKMKDGKSFIVGDMTGVGKGRTAAALIRWGLQHGKKVLFVTEKSGLFSDMHRDLTDIGCDYLPFVTNSDPDANITDADGNKVISKPMLAAQKALWQSGSDKLPRDKKGRQYDFVMTTYSQVNGNEKGDKKKAEWLREYAKDAIVIMDESHNASGDSNTGAYFREVVENASGVTFLSATYAKRPDNMLLYAIKSSMSAINMPVQSFLEAIKEYGVAMQELMASALFGSGEMIRRERDMSDVKTTWTDPKEIYSEEEYEQCRKTSDKTMDLINDIIQFQRDYVNPIVADHEKDYDQQNKIAALIGGIQTHAGNTAYKSQVSNVTNLMVYAMKAKKAAEMAIEQIKQGKKPVIAVSNTMGSYIDELDDDIPEAGFRPIFEKGVKFSLRYVIADYEKGDDGKYHKIKGSERVFDAEDELSDAGQRALDNLRQRIEDYMGDTDKVDLSLSPIDLVKQMIADAGYNCGEITGRSTQLVRKDGGGYTKTSIRQNKKEAARKFNGGSKDKPIPENEQYQALILNVAGATGISLHSSKKFGNQQPRTMIILQPNADVNKEVQMRGRIDRTGQVHRGEYFYMSSPIPAEQKITMMLKQKLASLDAQSVGTKKVSSNKVESQDMDNKYGDEVCYQYLLEHLNDVNAYLEDGLQWNRKTREWEGRPGLLYDVMKALQRMPCEMQDKVIAELNQRYADQIEYLNQNGINDLETTTMDLEAVTIDKATFVKGNDNESENEFAHDTAIERVEVNVLKKPMRSSDIKKKMKELDALDEDGLPKEGVLGQTDERVKAMMEQKIADRQARYDEQEAKLEEKVRSEHPKKPEQSDEEYEVMIKNWPSLVEMQNKHKADIAQYSADLQNQYNLVYRAGMYLKPGRPYLVPLTDDISDNGALMYGRFLGFQLKNGDPRQVQAVFAVKDSRAMITIPVVNKSKVIDKIINERGDIDISELEIDKNSYSGELLPMEQRAKNWDEWWDKMIPKNTNRQVRFMITGNVLQACGSLGKYKGQIVTFTRKNKETGEITLERGMLLAENFDPENFKIRRPVEKKDVWDNYNELKDERSGISCHREGNNMVVKFEKRKGEKLSGHPVQKDQEMKDLAMNGEIRPSGKNAILCVVKEENVEKALEHLYKEYGYTKEELFVMPDSTEKPDAIVRTNRPWKDVIDEYAPKYGSNKYTVDFRIKKMLKRYKMDVNNDDLKQQIREAVQLRQAYLRKDYADRESNRLAWEVLILDQRIEEYKDDKDYREDAMRKREAILEELEFRGFKGKAYHFEQGRITLDEVKKMFKEMNDESTEEGKAKSYLFKKVMAKVSQLPMEIFMNEKLDNDTGGVAGGKNINYNWKYMNADYISDQAKADTILHELIHTVTAYADRCVENGLEHLLDQEMIDAINELHGIFEAIKSDPTFVHDGVRAYGVTNVREMLSEAGSNSEFRADLKKTNLWQKVWMNVLKFFGIKQNVQGAKQVNALESVLLRLDYLIENFNKEAWDNFYGYGSYKKMDAQKIDTSDPMEAIEQAAESWQSKMTDQQVDAIIAAMKRNAIAAPSIEVTEDNWTDNVDTPIGNVKMGEHQKEKLFKNARQGQYGMVLETLSHPDIILEEMDKDEDPSHERPSSYLFVKTFTKPDGNKYVHFESVTVSKDGMEVSISSHIIRENQLRNKLKSDRLLYNATALDKSANSSAEQPINDGGSHSSDGKDSKKANTKQEKQDKKAKINTSDPIDAISRAADGFNDGQVNNPSVHSAKAVYNERLDRVETVFTEAYQDSMVSLKTAQNAIAGDQDIPDSQNAYMAENLMHGKNKNEQDLYNRMFRDPLIQTINKIMNLTGMNWGDVDRYVYTKSGLERNREFFMRDWLELQRVKAADDNAELARIDRIERNWKIIKQENFEKLQRGEITFPEYLSELDNFIRNNAESGYDPSEHDYSGFRAMFGDEDGDYDESDIINELVNTEAMIEADNVDVLWTQINAATRYGLERYREAGMRSDAQIDEVEQMFHWYVPMRGFKEDRGEDMYQYFTGKDKAKSYVGGLLKHAKGRGSEANYPISTIFAMTYKAISDCNQNLVNQKLYRLVQANPNDLVVLSDSWVKHNPSTDTWEEVMPPITDDMDEEEVRQATIDFENEMNDLARKGEAKKIRGRAKLDYVPMDKKKKSEHIVEVRINGDKKLIIVTGNPRMAQALNGQLRFERGKNVFSKWNSAIKNMMASMFTSYSPTFALRNMFRDWTHFRTMLGVREGRGYAKQANKYYRQSLFKMVGLFKKYREGTLNENNEMERDFKDFMDNGGITGFVQMQKIDDIQKQMEKLRKQQKAGKTIRLNNEVWDYTLGAIEALNEGIENNARFATYRASRHYAGRTKARSAYDAKEITVNFNRKGAGGKTAGYKSQSKVVEDAAKTFGVTSQILGEGRIFFNATVQAIATTFKNFQNADGSLNKKYIAKWASKYALPPFMFGLLLPYINQVLAAALGGDGDDDPYANLPEWTRRKNICIYVGNDSFVTIPIGQELAAFLALGDIVAGNTYAPNLKPVDRDFGDEFLGVMNTFSPVDIDTKITKGGIMEDPIDEVVGRTFSVLAPLVAVGQNLGWTGRPIYREDKFDNDQYTPEYQMVYQNTNPVLVNASKMLHELGGGDDITRGKLEVNPAIIQYLWEQYTGGPGKVISNTISIGKDAKDVMTGNESDFNIRKVEGLKAFVQQGDDRTAYYRTLAKYRKYKDDAAKLYDAVKGYESAAAENPEYMLKLMDITKGEDIVRMQIVREADTQLSKINKAANKAEGAERKELRRLYNQQVKEVVDMLDQVGKE